MSNVHNAVETIAAAASAIVAAESRVQPESAQKKRWGSWWSSYWCFGWHRCSKRISHAVFASEAPGAVSAPPTLSGSHAQTSVIVLPFIAPPSSPASFLQSEPPSATQSPACFLSLSLAGPASKFAIGPYAHETQLVTPPAFSGFNTEPSTAPFTPPPEPVLIPTTPPSPEVPFAELLTSSLERARRNGGSKREEFQAYHFYSPAAIPGVEAIDDHRVSFELSGEEVARRSMSLNEAFLEKQSMGSRRHQPPATTTKEFNFESLNDGEECAEGRPSSTWSYFHLLQPQAI